MEFPMTTPAFDPKSTFPNQDNFKRKLPSREERKSQIKKLKIDLHDDKITLKKLIVGAAYLTPFFVLISFAAWFAWH